MSSSNRSPQRCDAVLVQQRRMTGPLQLPSADQQAFVDQFNHVYRSIGLVITPTADDRQDDPQKNPGHLE